LPDYCKLNFSCCWLTKNSFWPDLERDLQLAFLHFKAIVGLGFFWASYFTV